MGATSRAGTAYPSEHTSSPSVFTVVRVVRSIVLCVVFVVFGHCVVCSSSIYGF
jgi:hypothetical protein